MGLTIILKLSVKDISAIFEPKIYKVPKRRGYYFSIQNIATVMSFILPKYSQP